VFWCFSGYKRLFGVGSKLKMINEGRRGMTSDQSNDKLKMINDK